MSIKAILSFLFAIVAPVLVIASVWVGQTFRSELLFISLFVSGVACLAISLAWAHEAVDETTKGRKSGDGIAVVALVLGYFEVVGCIIAIYWMFTTISQTGISSGMLWGTAMLSLIVIFALLMTLTGRTKNEI